MPHLTLRFRSFQPDAEARPSPRAGSPLSEAVMLVASLRPSPKTHVFRRPSRRLSCCCAC